MLTRRELLVGLAGLATGCARRARLGALPVEGVGLGWRWVPGAEHTWRTTITRTAGRVRAIRIEEWTWLVRDLDADAVATLEGRLVGFGSSLRVDDAPLPHDRFEEAEETEERALGPATLRVGMDGRLHACDPSEPMQSLPHRMLALKLPLHPMNLGGAWVEDELIRSLIPLLPPELPVRIEGEARLAEVSAAPEGTLARLETTGALRTPRGGPAIQLQGSVTWSVARGLLDHRLVQLDLLPHDDDPIRGPGTLTVELDRI